MALFKNVASQKVPVYAYNSDGAVTGDAANITGSISKDGAAADAITGTNPTEIGNGWYVFDLAQAETNGNLLVWYGESATSGVTVDGGAAYTVVANATSGLQSVDVGAVAGDADRGGYLDQLNIGAETLAHTGNAASFKADVSGVATAAALTAVADLLEADISVDKTTTPWSVVWKHKTSQAELLRKSIKDVDGANITATTTIVGQLVEPA